MAKTLHARLVAYRPFGDRIGVLAEPVSFSASMLHNDDGALSLEYSLLSGDAQAFDRELTDGLEVAVEVSDGSGYREPDNARFVITGRSGKTDDRTKTITYSGQSIGWLLSKAENNDSSHLIADGDNKGKRPFYSSNPGTILKTLLDENRARGGVATGLTLGFDTAKDSAGSNWAKKYTLYYSLGTDLQTILDALVNGGGCDWRTSGRTLKLWNADSTALSRDLSKSIVLQLARDISEAPFEESIADLASTILVEGDNNLLFRMDNPAAPTPWGKWESYSSQGGVSDKDTAQAFMRSTLDDAARVRGQYTRGLVTANVDNLPLIDYHAGDWITAPTVAHGEKVRVQEIDLSMRQNEGLSASIALNDIKYDASVRQAKKIKGITGGAALAGSEGGTTASSDRDHRVPKAPQGLVVQTDAYIGSDGFAHGLATAMWSAVTEATNDTAIEISNYAVEWKQHKDGAPWHAAGTTDKLQLGFGNLDCGTQIEVRVRAVPTYSDKLGDWSAVVVATVESDTTPCSVPSKPTVSSKLGVVTVHWDGKTAAGAQMEPDFDHIEVGEGINAAGMQVISATQSGQGDYVITGLTGGSPHSYALRSVDHAGNKSDWSAIATVTVASAVSPDEVEQMGHGLFFRYVFFYAFTSAVKTDTAAGGAYVAIVGIGHFARPVYDAAHDGDFQSRQVCGGGLYAGYGGLQVIKRTAAAGAADVFRAGCAYAGCLQNAEGGLVNHLVADRAVRRGVKQHEAVSQSVNKERATVSRGGQLEVFNLSGAKGVVFKHHYGVHDVFHPQFVYQGPQFAQAVGMLALGDDYDFRVLAQAGAHLVIAARDRLRKRNLGTSLGHMPRKHEMFGGKGRIGAGAWLPYVGIHNVGAVCLRRIGQVPTGV